MTEKSKTKEKIMNPWSRKNVCEVCNETCVSADEKKEHEAKKTHIKKFAIKTFLNTYLKSSNSNLPSALARRFRTSKEKAAGLECLHEFRFPWCSTGWWACSICYESGCSLEQAEHHVRSPNHLTAYLEEFDPDKAVVIKNYKHRPIEYYTELIRARDELYETQGEIPPEVFELDMSKEDAMVKLVVANLPSPPKETLTLSLGDDETVKRAIVRCTACHVVIPCFRKNLNKVWNVHENSPEHRKASAVLGILTHLNVEEVLDDENEESGALAYHWRRINSTYFGPICGKNHLLAAGKQNFCLLCQCVVNSVEEHFSSEFHILRFLCTKKTQDIIRYIHQSPDVRRAKMMDLLSKITVDNDKHRKLDSDCLPEPILDLRSEEKLDVEEFMFPLASFGADLCLVCGICKCVIKVEKDDAPLAEGIWNDHVTSTAHFDVLSRQSCYRFYDEFFVPLLPTVKTLPPTLHGEWKNFNVDDKMSYKIQTQCDVGLEWIVEDQEAGEVVCTLCARTYKKDSIDGINNHIRSYMHLNQYLHYDKRDFLALLMGQPNEKSVLDLMLDWLQRTYAPVDPFYYDIGHMYRTIKSQNWGQIRVYSPEKATNIAKKMTVPHRMTQLPYYLPEFRPAAAVLWPVIDQISNDGEDKLVKDLQDALMFSTCRIVWMDDQDNKLCRKWILRCMACQMLIPTTVETLLHDVFDAHLFDDEHDRRLQAYAQLESDRCCFAESTSNHTVKPFVQPDPVKKLSWHFNPDYSKYQYVLSVVGLEDMIERKSSQNEPDRPPDFFCRLCALSIPRRHVALELHVRSREHIFNYVQKYFPMSSHELDVAKNDPKVERRVLAGLVKDVKPTKEYPIPVFDPLGEQERTRAQMEEEQKEKVRQENLAVSRKKAEQERLAREQQKLKVLAREKEVQDRIKNETLQREKKIRDRADRLKAETERLKEDLAREQKKKIKEEAEKARQFAIAQAEMDKLAKRQRDDKKTLLEIELQKLQSLKKKEEEKRKKEELQSLAERANALSNKYQPMAHPMMSQMNMPPPAMPMNFSVPPPNYMAIGPKPVFNSFVPTVAAMPVYPMGAEDMDISHGRSRSPSPRRRRRSRSRSRSRERRSRRHSRSPPRRSPPRHARRDISPPHKRRSLSPIQKLKKEEPVERRPSLRGRTVDLTIANPSLCSNRAQLVDYMWRQGAERIPSAEKPIQFSKKACSIEGNVGVDSVYEVVCIDSPELETYYCSICGIWNNPKEMIAHLGAPQHRLAFLFRNHKNIHANIMTETDSLMRETLLRAYIEKVWKNEKADHPGICARLTTLLDRATIQRVCPEYVVSAPKSVQRQPEPTRISVPAPIQMDVLGSFAPKPAFAPPPLSSLPPGFNAHFPPPGMPPLQSMPPLVPPGQSSKTSSRSDERRKSRSPRSSRKRSRSRDRRRSPYPRRRDDSRRSPPSKRSLREDRDDRSRRSRSRSRSRRSGDRRTVSTTSSKDNINWASKVEQFIKKTAGDFPPVTSFPAGPSRAPEVVTLDDAPTPVKDGTALQRKLLGLMCMIQTDVEATGNVDPNKIRQMAADMGINMGDKEPQEAIAALLESTQKQSAKTNFNLAEFGIQPMAQQPTSYPQYHPYQQPPAMQSYQKRDDPTLTGILQGIPKSLAQLNQKPRPLSPIIKPISFPFHFGKTEEYFKESSMSIVYPYDPEELQRESKEKQERKNKVAEKLRATIADLQARTDKLQNNDDDDDWDSLENDLGQLIEKKVEAPKVAAPAAADSSEIIEVRSGPMRMGVPTSWQQPVPQPVKPIEAPVQMNVPVRETIPIAPGQKMLLARTILPNGKAIPQPEAPTPVVQQQFNSYPTASTSVTQTVQATAAYPFQQPLYNQQAFNPAAFQQPPPFYQPGQYQAPPPQFTQQFQQQAVPAVQPTAMHPPGTDPQQQNYFYQQQYRY